MSMNFSAMQYEKSFDAKKLRNWELQKQYKIGEPRTHVGFTTVIANERGHLLPGVQRSKDSPWGNYVGTWDLLGHAPGNYIDVPTGRAQYAQEKLKRDADDFRRMRQETVDKKAACGSPQNWAEAEGKSNRSEANVYAASEVN